MGTWNTKINGNYTVVLTNITACTASSGPFNYTFSNINETSGIDFTVYPNPSDGIFTIRANNSVSHSYRIDVYNQLGSLVYSVPAPFNTQIIEVNLSSLAAGLYHMRITGEDLNFNTTLIKNQ
jgi:hypothetical protein